jgi:uncharacterized protein YuzE
MGACCQAESASDDETQINIKSKHRSKNKKTNSVRRLILESSRKEPLNETYHSKIDPTQSVYIPITVEQPKSFQESEKLDEKNILDLDQNEKVVNNDIKKLEGIENEIECKLDSSQNSDIKSIAEVLEPAQKLENCYNTEVEKEEIVVLSDKENAPLCSDDETDKELRNNLEKTDCTILIIGEEGCGKTSLIKLMLNSFKGNLIENIEFLANNQSDFISSHEKSFKSKKYELTSSSLSETKGLRFYFATEKKSLEQTLIIDTPGIMVQRNAVEDIQYLNLINTAIQDFKIDFIVYVHKSDSSSLNPALKATIEKLAVNIKEFNFRIFIVITFFAGKNLFKKEILPFNQDFILGEFKLDNKAFAVDEKLLMQKISKFKDPYEKSIRKIEKLRKMCTIRDNLDTF